MATNTKATLAKPGLSKIMAERCSWSFDEVAEQFEEHIAEMKARSEKNRERMQAGNTQAGNQSSEQARKAAIADAQEQAKKHMEKMKQSRQAYEKEMEKRRQQYEVAKKAQQEKPAKLLEARKAEFQLAEKKRLETKQKVQEKQKKIAELQNEIRQIINEAHPQYRNNAARPTQPRVAE